MTTASCGFPDGDSLYRFGPTLLVEVGFDATFQPHNNRKPILPTTPWPGLVDTGALECCIDSLLAIQLGLPVVDHTSISGAGGLTEVNYHLAQIYIPTLNYTVYGAFAGVHLAAGGQPHSVLIGRTLLRHFRMEYDGRTGAVTITT